MRIRPLAVALVALAVLGACGGGAKLSDAALRPSDFPAGWTSTPVTGAGDRFDRELAACLQVPVTTFSGGPGDKSVTAPTFGKGSELGVAQRVTVRGTEDAARKELDQFTQGRGQACATKVLGTNLHNRLSGGEDIGAKLGPQTVVKVSVPKVADERVAFEIRQPVTVLSTRVEARVRLVILRKGRGVAMLTTESNAVPFPADLATELVKAVAGRLPSK